MKAELLGQCHVEVGGVSVLALGDDAAHTLHGEDARGPAQVGEGPAGVRLGVEDVVVVLLSLLLLGGLHWGTGV